MGLFNFMQKKHLFKLLADFSRYAEGYNCSKDYAILLWSVSKVGNLQSMLFDDSKGYNSHLADYFEQFMKDWQYSAYDYVLLHRCDFDRLLGELEYQINEKYKG
jgi:hypothetical protein